MRRHYLFRIFTALLMAGCTACTPQHDKPLPPVAPNKTIAVIGAQDFHAPAPGVKLSASAATSTSSTQASDVQATGKIVRVGLLVPLTGRNATLGRALQDAATIALYDKYANISDQNTVHVELLPKDTGDSPEQAAQAMHEALNEGASFIVGPVFADATSVAAPLAREKNIGVLSFSNTLSSAGQGVYAFGFSPQDQTRRVMEFALHSGKTRFVALVPNSALGTAVLTAAKDVLAQHNQSFAVEATYAPQGLGVDAAVNQLVPPGTKPNFDAILLPEGGDIALGTIMRTLAAHGVNTRNVQFLGTGMWDDGALVRRVPLDGAWLASSSPDRTDMFDTRFRKTFNYAPPRVASLAYDAVSFAVTLATTGRDFDQRTLTSIGGFNGPANGMFRLRPDGRTDRGLAVLQVDGSQFKVISPSPNVFTAE